MNFWLLPLLILEILFIIISFILSTTIYKLSFLETINIIGSIFSIQGVLLGIIFLICQNKQTNEITDHILHIRREMTT